MILSENSHLLFFGDSITDAGRDRNDPSSLGGGYVNLISARLLSQYPEKTLRISNMGIGGNRIANLEERFEQDVLRLEPTVVSLLIGINDTWRRYDSEIVSLIPEFQDRYSQMVKKLVDRGIHVIICEPFLLPFPEDRKKWREDLNPRLIAIREVAWEYNLPYLPLDGAFAAAASRATASYWLKDGVHPTLAGHSLIAESWLDLVVDNQR